MDALRRIVQSLRVSSRSAELKLGISGAQLFVMQRLAEAPSLSVNELAARTYTHQSSVSTVVSRLVERGLVARKRSDADARRVELALTREGRALVKRGSSMQLVQERLIEALHAIPERVRHQLASNLTTLAEALGAQDETPPALFFEEAAATATRRRSAR